MPVVDTTRTFTNNEQITSTKLNEIMDNSSFVSGAVVSSGGLEVTDGGQMQISTNGVTTTKIANLNVTTAKIADSSITTAKIADSNITTAKIADASVTPAKLAQLLTSATAKNSTSGTSIDFTGIPSWVKRITVMFNGVSTNGGSIVQIRLGTSGGIVSTGYSSRGNRFLSTSTAVNVFAYSDSSTGFNLESSLVSGAASSRSGLATITLINGNTWVLQSYYGVGSGESAAGTGVLDLGGTLDRVRITTVNGTDTFDAGSINIMYE